MRQIVLSTLLVLVALTVSAQNRKDDIERRFQTKQDALDDQLADLRMKKAQATAQAVQGVTSAMGNIASIV